MLRYKFNVLQSLINAGYSTYRLRQEKLLGQKAIQQLRDNEMIGIIVLETLCGLLNLQPGDIIEYVPDDPNISTEGDQQS